LMKSRVVITGIGVISSIGIGRESFWSASLEGRSGAVRLDTPWVRETGLATQIACPVRDFDPVKAGIPHRVVHLMDRTTLFALAAAHEALADAGFTLTPDPEDREGLRVGDVETPAG